MSSSFVAEWQFEFPPEAASAEEHTLLANR